MKGPWPPWCDRDRDNPTPLAAQRSRPRARRCAAPTQSPLTSPTVVRDYADRYAPRDNA